MKSFIFIEVGKKNGFGDEVLLGVTEISLEDDPQNQHLNNNYQVSDEMVDMLLTAQLLDRFTLEDRRVKSEQGAGHGYEETVLKIVTNIGSYMVIAGVKRLLPVVSRKVESWLENEKNARLGRGDEKYDVLINHVKHMINNYFQVSELNLSTLTETEEVLTLQLTSEDGRVFEGVVSKTEKKTEVRLLSDSNFDESKAELM